METGNPMLTFAVGMDKHQERVARAVARQGWHEAAATGAGWRRALAAALVALAAHLVPAPRETAVPLPAAAS
ncbi:MAG TPA: hypothetical protein VFW96_11300 [Thermomicrobiales bacterium]|nr:hypothetical protein [Thermomicrobiales bacterium]